MGLKLSLTPSYLSTEYIETMKSKIVLNTKKEWFKLVFESI